MAGPGLVFIAYPKAITQMPLPPLLLHFFYGKSWSCFPRLSKGYHTDAVTTITVTLLLWQVLVLFSSPIQWLAYHTEDTNTITVTLLLWQVLVLFSPPIQRLSHRCRYHNYCYASFMAGPGLVFVAYPKAITQKTLTPFLLHFFNGRSWSCFHRLSKGYHTDAVTTITFTLLLWQVLVLFSSPIQRLSHRCRYHHYCYTSFMAGPGLVFIAYPMASLSHRRP